MNVEATKFIAKLNFTMLRNGSFDIIIQCNMFGEDHVIFRDSLEMEPKIVNNGIEDVSNILSDKRKALLYTSHEKFKPLAMFKLKYLQDINIQIMNFIPLNDEQFDDPQFDAFGRMRYTAGKTLEILGVDPDEYFKKMREDK